MRTLRSQLAPVFSASTSAGGKHSRNPQHSSFVRTENPNPPVSVEAFEPSKDLEIFVKTEGTRRNKKLVFKSFVEARREFSQQLISHPGATVTLTDTATGNPVSQAKHWTSAQLRKLAETAVRPSVNTADFSEQIEKANRFYSPDYDLEGNPIQTYSARSMY